MYTSLSVKARSERVACEGRLLSVRLMGIDEIRGLYLPLRYEILCRELGWTVGEIKDPEELYDDYDRFSTAFGIFYGNARLLAAGRLIQPNLAENLPSVHLLAKEGRDHEFAPPVTELSRILVARPYRAIGLFRLLLLTGISLSCGEGIRSLIITERDDEHYAALMARNGFSRHANGYAFFDGKLDPQEPAATYVLNITDDCRVAIETATRAERADVVKRLEYALERSLGTVAGDAAV